MNLEQIDKKYVMQTYARNYTNFIKGDNATLYDDKNEEYIDFMSGIAVVGAGHANQKINNAIKKQLDNITHISNLFVIEPQAKLAQKISDKLEQRYNVFFCNSGTEANEGAIKLARKYGEENGDIKRFKIITLKNSFHGRTITSLKATGQESMHNYFGPFPDGFVYAENIQDIKNHIDDKTIAVMIELVQGEGGVEVLDKKSVQEIEKLCKSKDVLFIVDEVQTGIYRSGSFLMSQLYDIKPNIITIAKGLGNGIPIGAILSDKKDILNTGSHGSTFGGNYISTTAGNAVLEVLEELEKNKTLNNTIQYFTEKMQNIQKQFPQILLSFVGVGMMLGFRVESQETLTKLINLCFQNKLLVIKAGKNTLRILPPLTITKKEIDSGFLKFQKSIEQLANNS